MSERSGTWATARWLQRHRTLARWLCRVHPIQDWFARRVWREAEADPAFVAGLAQGKADFEAGRWFSFDPETGETTRNPDWPESLA